MTLGRTLASWALWIALAGGCSKSTGEGTAPAASTQPAAAAPVASEGPKPIEPELTAAPAPSAAPTTTTTAPPSTTTTAPPNTVAKAGSKNESKGAATPTPTAPAPTAAAPESSAPARPRVFECGEKGQAACPTQAWMKANLAPAVASDDAAALAKGLNYVAAHAPANMPNWATVAKAGASKAASGDMAGAKATCKTCHDQYKAKYKAEMRDRSF